MKKSLTIILASFFILGILMNSYFVFADDNSASPNALTLTDNASPTYQYGNSYVGPSIRSDNYNIENRMENNTEMNYTDNGRKVQVNREVQVEDGNVTVIILKTVTYANGSQSNYTIQINKENNSGTLINTMSMERNRQAFNVSVEDGLNVSDQFFGNQSQIIVNLPNGSTVNITVLPDEAMQKVLERLSLMNLTFSNGTNASIQLQEKIHKNIPQVVYNIEGDKLGKFLGIFKLNMRVSTEVDPKQEIL